MRCGCFGASSGPPGGNSKGGSLGGCRAAGAVIGPHELLLHCMVQHCQKQTGVALAGVRALLLQSNTVERTYDINNTTVSNRKET